MNKAPISVRIIYFLTQIIFWFILLITLATFVVNIMLVLGGSFAENFQLRIQLPVMFSVDAPGEVSLFGNTHQLYLESATSRVHVVDTPVKLSAILARVVLVVSAIALFITWKFKSFLGQIRAGNIFHHDNIQNLKHISYAILGLWLVTNVYIAILYHAIFKFAEFPAVTFTGEVNYEHGLVFVAMLLWVLAHVFEKGQEMKQEQELTI